MRKAAILAAFGLLAGAQPVADALAQGSINSSYCRNLYRQMATKPPAKAMALSRDGKVCSAYWGEATQRAANRKAIAGCEEDGERKCSLIRLG